ncbi:DUF1642 domain-containing protein [Aerococcaceae bacterium NML190073]|nr:DUF1642 domain-containing protein [Aerococcaceae bacterium NML190073]
MRIWHCETQEQYDYLMKQLEAEGCEWAERVEPTHINRWLLYSEQTCIRESAGILSFARREFYEIEYPNTEIQPVVIPEQKQDKENKKMNKQELIEKLNILPKYSINTGRFYNIGIGFRKRDVLDLVEQLDEPQKVVIPKEIAEWIEEAKTNYLEWNDHSKGDFVIRCVYDLFQYGEGKPTYDFDINDMISEWSKDNPYTFVRAIIDGYEVEKEKLYTVVLPDVDKFKNSHYLRRDMDGSIRLSKGVFNVKEHTKLTEAEIKSLDERYMAFAQEVTE